MSDAVVMLGDEQGQHAWADWVGMVASIGCAIHCAAMPLVIAYLPMLGLSWLADEGFHQWMALFCFGLAVMAFVPGWRKHRSFMPMFLGGAGVLLLTTAAFGLECDCCPSNTEVQLQELASTCSDPNCAGCGKEELSEPGSSESSSLLSSFVPFVTPLGGVLLVFGHITNHRKSCKCQGDSCCVGSAEEEMVE